MNDKPPKPTPKFPLNELIRTLEELTKGEEDSQGFFTTSEICEKRKWGREKVQRLLRKAKEEGRLIVGSKKVVFLDDRSCDVAAYKFKSKEEEEVLSIGLGVAIGGGAYLLSIFPEAKPAVESLFWGLIAGLTAGGFYTAQKILRS